MCSRMRTGYRLAPMLTGSDREVMDPLKAVEEVNGGDAIKH